MGEQVEVVGYRNKIRESEHKLGEPLNRQDRPARVAIFEQRLNVCDVFAYCPADQIGDDEKNDHRDNRPAAQ